MGEMGKRRQIKVKNGYGEELDLGFFKTIWIFKISKMHHSEIEIKII
jgi:hypothetical protein